MSQQYCKQLEEIYTKTQEILNVARSERWDEVLDLIQDRHKFCEKLDLEGFDAKLFPQAERTLLNILTLEKQVADQIKLEQSAIGENLAKLTKGRMALASYKVFNNLD